METALIGKITSALRKSPYLDFSTLSYEAKEGRVVLKGTVRTYVDKQMVQESLRPIEGIYEIVNDLEVMFQPLRVDETQ